MRQFDVCENPSPRTRNVAPYVVVLQSHFLGSLPTTVVAPLLLDNGRPPYTEATVTVDMAGQTYVASIVNMASVPTETLRRPVGSLKTYEDDIRRALDRIFTGF